MREYEIDDGAFIGGWYIPEKVCDELIELFQTSQDRWVSGRVGDKENPNGVVDPEWKKSTELYIRPDEFFKLLTYFPHLNNCLNEYRKKFPHCDKVHGWGITTPIKIQHYKPGEGFYKWHAENTGDKGFMSRHLVFMTYLNTLDNAGTDFYHQKHTTPCQKGLTLIWPAGWTHSHRGVTNHTSDKYIITGWYDFYDQ